MMIIASSDGVSMEIPHIARRSPVPLDREVHHPIIVGHYLWVLIQANIAFA